MNKNVSNDSAPQPAGEEFSSIYYQSPLDSRYPEEDREHIRKNTRDHLGANLVRAIYKPNGETPLYAIKFIEEEIREGESPRSLYRVRFELSRVRVEPMINYEYSILRMAPGDLSEMAIREVFRRLRIIRISTGYRIKNRIRAIWENFRK